MSTTEDNPGEGARNNERPQAAAPSIPIFVITHNRLTVLKRTLTSFARVIDAAKTPYEVVVHDNASTYEPLRAYLRQSGLRVYWNAGNDLDDVAYSIEAYFSGTCSASSYYVVTDPDIELDETMILDRRAYTRKSMDFQARRTSGMTSGRGRAPAFWSNERLIQDTRTGYDSTSPCEPVGRCRPFLP